MDMTDQDKTPAQEKAAWKSELIAKLTKLSEGDDQTDVRTQIDDFLSDELKHSDLPFAQSGQTIGLNYNVDEYFVDLPNGKVLNYGIGGSASTYIEQVRIMTQEEAEQKQEIMDLAAKANDIASKVVNDGGPKDREMALLNISDLKEQVGLIEDWLKERIHEDKSTEEEDEHESVPSKDNEIRAMYNNPEDRAAYQNARDTDQFVGTWEEWMLGKK